MRAEQRKVVEGMAAASKARMEATGRGLQDTGTASKPCAGEEIDWYSCCMGAWHLRASLGLPPTRTATTTAAAPPMITTTTTTGTIDYDYDYDSDYDEYD